MEVQIKRGTYFDGQFLQQAEFNDEGIYHRHMRRRVNYTLFDQTGVLELTPTDLRITVVSVAGKTFQVQPGTAISLRPGDAEGKEVVLRAVSPTLDISAFPNAVTKAWVTIRYLETAVAAPPSPGSLSPTRVIEDSIIEVFQAQPPAVEPITLEDYIVIGTISLPGMTPVYAPDRMIAHLRAGILGGVPAVTTVTITGISVAGGTAGTVVTAVISGTNLAGATGVTFSQAGVTAVITGSTATTINVTITIANAATAGAGTFTVTVAAGTATSAPGAFTVTAATPVAVSNVAPIIRNAGLTLTLTGSNIRNAAIVPGNPAAGTVVQFLDSTGTTVMATDAAPTALADIAGPNPQQIRATIPARTSFTPVPLAGTNQNIKVQVTYAGGTGVWFSTVQVNF